MIVFAQAGMDLELRFKAVFGLAVRRIHDAGIAHQHIQALMRRFERICELAHTVE